MALRHDKPLRTARVQAHLRHVPSYLMPTKEGGALTGAEAMTTGASVPFKRANPEGHHGERRVRRRNNAPKVVQAARVRFFFFLLYDGRSMVLMRWAETERRSAQEL